MRTWITTWAALAAGCACMLGHAHRAEAQAYTITNLGDLGGTSSHALGLNNAGLVVGQATTPDGTSIHAFAWNGTMSDLGTVATRAQSAAFSINEQGLVAGMSYDLGNLNEEATLWDLGGAPGTGQDIGTFIGRAINATGEIAGVARLHAGDLTWHRRGARWSNGTMDLLGTLGGPSSEAYGLNDMGWIVGQSTLSDEAPPHAVIWIDGVIHDLGTLGGDQSSAYDINSAGQVAGMSRTATGSMRGFSATVAPGGQVLSMAALAPLGGDHAAAYAINASGAIVGTSNDRACLWQDGVAYDLNDLILPASGWVLRTARDINDAGQIVGDGSYLGRKRAFRLTPGAGCADVGDCADLDDNGVRDDPCVWWTCAAGACSGTAIAYADMGGSFGSCPPDGIADANDRFHALNCFSDQTVDETVGYPCEGNPPAALNVDAAGQSGPCIPDGVCDGHDAFAALNAFNGSTTCSCSAGPAPLLRSPTLTTDDATLRLEPARTALRGDHTCEIHVWLASAVHDLRGYQLHVDVTGGTRGSLDIIDLSIENREEHVFAGLEDWRAFNVGTRQVLCGLDTSGVPVAAGAYLATVTLRASPDAAGRFVVDLRYDTSDPADRTVLFPTRADRAIAVTAVEPALVDLRPGAGGDATGESRSRRAER